MKPLVAGLYIVLVGIGGAGIALRSRRAFEFTATRDLPLNHRVLASDLREPDTAWALTPSLPEESQYTGRYLDRRIDAGHPLKREYLRTHPAVAVAPNAEPFAWLLPDKDKQWLQVLDVGWTVDLCAETCPVMDAPVLALECASPNSGPCEAVLQLTAPQREALLAYAAKSKLSLAVSRVDLGGRK